MALGSAGGTGISIAHDKPPSVRIREVFLAGARGKAYSKTRDAKRVLRDQDLSVAAAACPELKSLLNAFLALSGASPI